MNEPIVKALSGNEGLRFGPMTNCAHICVDMQCMFSEQTPWHAPWISKVLPNIVRLVDFAPSATVFTRFIPLRDSSDGIGAWRRFYEHWSCMTLNAIAPHLIDLVAPLNGYVPPATIIDKRVYSPWSSTSLHAILCRHEVTTLVISGAETDMCVAATILGAVDLGYRVVLAADAMCSSSDVTHDAAMELYRNRYSQQIELSCVEEILEDWKTLAGRV